MKNFWLKIWVSRLHSSQIFTVLTVGVLIGIIVVMVNGLRFFVSPLCLILAIALFACAYFYPSYVFVVLAFIGGILMGSWRASNYLVTAGAGDKGSGISWLGEVRDDYANGIRENVAGEESALGLSYLLGMKEELTDEMEETLRAVGLTHIVVASGTHLSILVELMRKVFGKLSRAAGTIFALLAIVIFASMIGWTPSITRAAVVSILSLVFGYVGRKFRPGRLILMAMAITLMMNPANITALGWMLSFAAYAGVMLVAPMAKRAFFGEEKPEMISEMVITTLAATLICLPLQLYYFGSLSLLALPANLLILPTIPYAMGLTFLAGVGGLLSPLGRMAGWAARWLLGLHLGLMRFLAEQQGFLVEVAPYQAWALWLYVPIVAFLLVSAWRQKRGGMNGVANR